MTTLTYLAALTVALSLLACERVGCVRAARVDAAFARLDALHLALFGDDSNE